MVKILLPVKLIKKKKTKNTEKISTFIAVNQEVFQFKYFIKRSLF